MGDHDDDEALQLALQLSLEDSQTVEEAKDRMDSSSGGPRRGRWARRARCRVCIVCSETVLETDPMSCCGSDVCEGCLGRWAHVQVMENEVSLADVRCPSCDESLDSELVSLVLDDASFKIASERISERAKRRPPPSMEELGLALDVLERFRTKRCPACGMGVQKESESCHKMICRTCRAKFCFRCLHRLEYFNCGCTGADHRFIDPVNGEIVAH